MYLVASLQPQQSTYDVMVMVPTMNVQSSWKDGIFQIVLVHFGGEMLVIRQRCMGEDNLVAFRIC